MPKTPTGAKRPADVIRNAVHVMRIATREAQEKGTKAQSKGGRKGGKARAKALTAAQRSEIASTAASARWKKG